MIKIIEKYLDFLGYVFIPTGNSQHVNVKVKSRMNATNGSVELGESVMR